jgi:hypothetical protein
MPALLVGSRLALCCHMLVLAMLLLRLVCQHKLLRLKMLCLLIACQQQELPAQRQQQSHRWQGMGRGLRLRRQRVRRPPAVPTTQSVPQTPAANLLTEL